MLTECLVRRSTRLGGVPGQQPVLLDDDLLADDLLAAELGSGDEGFAGVLTAPAAGVDEAGAGS
jgi:hypothetical protein